MTPYFRGLVPYVPHKIALMATRIRVSSPNFEERARTSEEVAITQEGVATPGEEEINTSPSPPTKEDVTLVMIVHAKYDKRPGTKTVSPLLKPGLSNRIFVCMCVLSLLELSRHCSFP